MWLRIHQDEIVVKPEIQALCVRPYPGHPHGCPNARRGRCFPLPKRFPKGFRITDRSRFYVIYNEFDLASHVRRMKKLHPNWSWRQLVCCLYWQPSARKQLRIIIKRFLKMCPGAKIFSPEAYGVDVTATMAKQSIKLEWPPENVVRQVVIAISNN